MILFINNVTLEVVGGKSVVLSKKKWMILNVKENVTVFLDDESKGSQVIKKVAGTNLVGYEKDCKL